MADPAVSDTDFRDILDATRQFIRSAVMPIRIWLAQRFSIARGSVCIPS